MKILLRKIKTGLKMLVIHGPAYTAAQIQSHLYVRQNSPKRYSLYMKMSDYSVEELDAQRVARFDESITFSILVPLYNTPKSFLVDMIESVRNQTCGDWQLCLADASDADHGEVGKVCLDYAARDKRICYRKLENNLCISGNTNAAIEMAEGDYIALLDHDDVLHPAALFEMRKAADRKADLIYTDEATFVSPDLNNIRLIHFKPDYAPDNLLANNYICHFMAFRRSLLDKTGAFRSQYDGSQDHDMVLRLTEVTDQIIHIPRVLYFWRGHAGSTAVNTRSKDYASRAGAQAVHDALARRGRKADVTIVHPGIYRVAYPIPDTPKVSIIIPSCDHVKDLSRCLDSIREKSIYSNYEIIIVENNSKDPSTFSYYKKICKEWDRVRVIRWKGPFNYSAINNFAVKKTDAGPYLLLLNNDTEVINGGWIEEMLMHACREEVGAVGAKLYFPNDTVQHAGVILGMGGVAAHSFYKKPHKDVGYMGRMLYSQNYTAVTGACMMMRRDVWDQVGGLDEGFAVAFNDVDLCMRIRSADYLIVWTPWAELFHYESASRGDDKADPAKKNRFDSEVRRFKERWNKELKEGDPYYNPNLTLSGTSFTPDFNRVRKQSGTENSSIESLPEDSRTRLLLENNIKTIEGIRQTLKGRMILKYTPGISVLDDQYVNARDPEQKLETAALLLNAYEESLLWRISRKLFCLKEDAGVAFRQRGKRKVIDHSPKKARDYYSVAVITNEPRYIKEFVLFYQATGADRIYVYDNDPSGSVEKALRPFFKSGRVVYIRWPGKVVQTAAYRDAVRRTKKRSRWLALVDTDEFLFSPKGKMPEQLKVYEDYPGVGVNWLMYGPNGHDKRPEGLVMDNYTQRLANDNEIGNCHIKSIVQPDQVAYIDHVHFAVYKGRCYAVNSEKKIIDNRCSYVENAGKAFTENNCNDIFRINHYHTKSLEDLREKCGRGYPDGAPPKTFEQQLWFCDSPMIEDYSIKPYADMVREKYELYK